MPLPLTEAVTLFVQRAAARSHRFRLPPGTGGVVRESGRRLDGLPLALELAAAWTKLLEPEALLARLDDRMEMLVGGGPDLPERQRTMHRTLEWSHELLEPGERELFCRLSVFRGGATLEAVEHLWRACSGAGSALHLVAALADKNLLLREADGAEPRVGMLQTVKEYASELLVASGGRDAAAHAHAEWCAALVEESERATGGRESWLARLERELPNLRAALQWASETGRAELGLRLTGRLLRLWEYGHQREGIAWLDTWLDAGPRVTPAVRALGLQARTVLAFRIGDYAGATRFGEACLALYRGLEDPAGAGGAPHS